jgi:hypothetical protein
VLLVIARDSLQFISVLSLTMSEPAASGSNLENDELKSPPVVTRMERGEKMPITILIVGMAGSGKTSLLTKLQEDLEENRHQSGYVVNLDPATLETPYEANIDIRDTVHYKSVMKNHRLGPNGAIMTSLNLFATKFDQVMNILEKRAYEKTPTPAAATNDKPKETAETTTDEEDDDGPMDYILVDTPGQIEAFTWSASGSIMSESLASAFPTVLCFVVDTARCASSPNTFMSNMLYACSVLYRTRLPLVVCFNKTDVVSHEFCMEWMRDHEAFQAALDQVRDDSGFYGSLTRSLSLVLDEFYSTFAHACGVSAVTGDGMNEFWETVNNAATQDFALYVEDLKDRIEEQQVRQKALARCSVRRLQQDLGEHNDKESEDVV